MLGDIGDRIVALGQAAAARTVLGRRRHYRICLCAESGRLHRSGQVVIADLARFAGVESGQQVALDGAGRADPIQMAVMLGRRQLLERVLQHVPPDDRDLFAAIAAAREVEQA